jgi:hypothetical protein
MSMKAKAIVLSGCFLFVLLSASVLADETVYFPFWQKGFGMNTFYSIVNAGTLPITVTVEQLWFNGGIHSNTTGYIFPGSWWYPDTSVGGWCWEDGAGFGRYIITSTENATWVWSCLYSYCPQLGGPTVDAQPGFTMTNPSNPCGNPALE